MYFPVTQNTINLPLCTCTHSNYEYMPETCEIIQQLSTETYKCIQLHNMWNPAATKIYSNKKTAKSFKHTVNKKSTQLIIKEHKELSEQNT